MVIDNYFFIASDDEINNESTTQQPTHSDDDEAPLSLVQKYINHGYILTLDNYYTSPELAEALLHFKTDCFGTLRKKAELPEDFWEWKPKKFDGPICQTSGDMMVMRWIDASKTKKTKIVSMLSTMVSQTCRVVS